MSSGLVFTAYVFAAIAAMLVVFFIGPRRWYWHVMSGLLALVCGLMPPWNFLPTQTFYLISGCLFGFFFVWALGGPAARMWKWHGAHASRRTESHNRAMAA